jgi:hypothetical protein
LSYNAAAERIKRALRAKRASKLPIGRAWTQWETWDLNQRRHILRVWCHLSKPQINHFCTLPWYSLNQHVRKAIKSFFRKTPTVDKVLGMMRYPEKKENNASPL